LAITLVVTSWCRAQDDSSGDIEAQEEQAIKAAVTRVAPSVVRIETLGGLERVGRVLVGTGPTTGLAVSEDGYVISSAFNFIQKPSSILVTLPGGKRAAAQIVARDNSRMLVLLKVNTEQRFVVPEAVPREQLVVGQWSIAVGRTFEGDVPNISVGVVSAVSRIWGKAIQTDAKVSPSNYGGPVVDIRGRVQGVLVPLSPQAQSEIAGAEWYDSGIGFAVPLADILPQLEKMKRGEDLHPGILGIGLKGRDIYSDPAEIAACQPKSPAYEAGLKAGDRIVEADGAKIERQAQLKHAIGRRYAGDSVQLVVMRDDKRMEVTVELTDKLEPYQHPFVGVLPLRSSSDRAGIGVRYVFPDSPADKAGITAGDRIVQMTDKPVTGIADAWQVLASHEPGDEIAVRIQRDGATEDFKIQLGALPTTVPGPLPPPRDPIGEMQAERPAVGVVEIKIPEEKNEAFAYVPEKYHGDVAYGLLVWLHPPGDLAQDKVVQRWKKYCEQHDMILLVPQAADSARWLPTELDFIRKTMDDVIGKYNVDETRVVAYGYQAGGAMALLTALRHRSLVRAVVAVDASLPARAAVAANDPLERLAFYIAYAKEAKLADRIAAGVKRLQDMKYPVIAKELDQQARDLNDAELGGLMRWFDSLDRI
jgi:serine protease Do